MSQRILPAEVSNTIVIQLNEHPRNELSKYTQNPRLTFHVRPNPCYFMGLLLYTEMAPLLPGMKIIGIKLKPVPVRAKNHKCLLVSLDLADFY